MNTSVSNSARKIKKETFWNKSVRTEANKMPQAHAKTSRWRIYDVPKKAK